MKRIGKILLGVTLAAGLVGGGIWYAKQRAANDPEQRYKLATIEKGEVTQTVSANGTLNPVILVNVGTQISGTIKTLGTDFNEPVKRGQVLARLDPETFNQRAQQAQAQLAQAQADAQGARASGGAGHRF